MVLEKPVQFGESAQKIKNAPEKFASFFRGAVYFRLAGGPCLPAGGEKSSAFPPKWGDRRTKKRSAERGGR
jgi:hypothetical protein